MLPPGIGSPVGFLAAPPAGVCGPETRHVCTWVYDHTGGNTFLASTADWLIGRPLAIVGVLLLGWVLRWLSRRIVGRSVSTLLSRAPLSIPVTTEELRSPESVVPADDPSVADVPTREEARRTTRAHAVATAVSSTVSTLIWVVIVIAVLAILGLDIEPIVAGAGLAGIAVAFGAQSLIKDILSGIFILLEDHFGIGDELQLGDATGVVEQLSLRRTVLRDIDGTVWHIRNGEIDKVGNLSQVWSGALIDISVSYGTDLTVARALLLDAAQTVSDTHPFADEVLGPPEVLGVESLDADGITLRLLVKTLAGRQFSLQRSLLEEINDSFQSHSVQISSHRVQVHSGQVRRTVSRSPSTPPGASRPPP
ncbi:mechanosensitive ion channel family protein [Nakamurella silvestris]|nr:mechanosensitive ion channel family protein [Nakamurella silvestris]